jgi:hypothetical protein
MKAFINRPIPRILRYELLLEGILDETPNGHEDIDTIPAVLDFIKRLEMESEHRSISAKQKVKLWYYNSNLIPKAGEVIVSLSFLNVLGSLRSYSGYESASRAQISHPHG